MPFKSKAQMRKLFATEPEVAERWAKHTPDIKSLPEKAPKKKEKKMKKKSICKKSCHKKAAFVADFCRNVYKSLEDRGIDKEAFLHTELAEGLLKCAARKPPMDKIVDMLGLGTSKGQLLTGLSILAPLTLGGVGGAAAARLTSPSETAIKNIQKEEVLARYQSAVVEAKARIAARRARGI